MTDLEIVNKQFQNVFGIDKVDRDIERNEKIIEALKGMREPMKALGDALEEEPLQWKDGRFVL
jgi:hypothetical protein